MREKNNMMKKFFAVLAVGLVMLTTAVDNAEAARRMGGGLNLGRPAPTLQKATPAPQAPALRQNQANRQNAAQQQNAAGAAANAAKPSMMRNILMGAAAALGITALLSALGLSEGLGQIIMVVLMALVLFFVLRKVLGLFAGRTAAAGNAGARAAGAAGAASPNSFSQAQQPVAGASQPETPAAAAAVKPETMGARPGSVMDMFARQPAGDVQGAADSGLQIPAGFDVEGFERVAKENFVRLQKAWDTGDYNSLSDFTTDELFIELTHCLRERGGARQTSEIINLDGKLLGVAKLADSAEHIAVVEFNGAMKIDGEFEEVHERWVLTRKDDDSSGWLLAGIEQVAAA